MKYLDSFFKKKEPLTQDDIETIEDLFESYIEDDDSGWVKIGSSNEVSNYRDVLDDPKQSNNCYSFTETKGMLCLDIISTEKFGLIFSRYKERLISYDYKINERYKHQGPITSGTMGVYRTSKKTNKTVYIESEYPLYKYQIYISK